MSIYYQAVAEAMFGREPNDYGWIIDQDHMPDETAEPGTNANAVGVIGPSDITPELQARLERGEGRKFKIYDDDNELYYTGRLVQADGEDDLGEQAFGPLDDFGTPNAGAVKIMYQFTDEHGHKGWETL